MHSSIVLVLLALALVAFTAARHHNHHKRRVDDENPMVIPVEVDEKPLHSRVQPFFETVDDQKDFISYDEEGKAYMLCGFRNNSQQESKRCYLPSDKPNYDMGLACYTLWQGSTALQDCWVNQMISLTQCQKRRCSAPDSPIGIRFCCCFGHECNLNYENEA